MNKLNHFSRLVAIGGLFLTLNSCGEDQNPRQGTIEEQEVTESQVDKFLVPEPQVITSGTQLPLSAVNANQKIKLKATDSILFFENESKLKSDTKIYLDWKLTCLKENQTKTFSNKEEYVQQIFIYEFLSPETFQWLQNEKSISCEFRFIASNKVGSQHRFKLGPFFLVDSNGSANMQVFKWGHQVDPPSLNIRISQNKWSEYSFNSDYHSKSRVQLACTSIISDQVQPTSPGINLVEIPIKGDESIYNSQWPLESNPLQICQAFHLIENRIFGFSPKMNLLFERPSISKDVLAVPIKHYDGKNGWQRLFQQEVINTTENTIYLAWNADLRPVYNIYYYGEGRMSKLFRYEKIQSPVRFKLKKKSKSKIVNSDSMKLIALEPHGRLLFNAEIKIPKLKCEDIYRAGNSYTDRIRDDGMLVKRHSKPDPSLFIIDQRSFEDKKVHDQRIFQNIQLASSRWLQIKKNSTSKIKKSTAKKSIQSESEIDFCK